MPGFKTHSIFGILAKRHLSYGYLKKCITKHPHAYQMGLQGPDFMFYYAPLHIIHKKNPADILHSTKVNDFFKALILGREYVLPADRQIVDSYISGFIGHYVLDSALHPYIYFRTNHFKHPDQKTYDFGIHSFLETDIDQACLEHFLQMDILDFKPWEKINLSKREAKVLAPLVHIAIRKTYPDVQLKPLHILHSFRAMRNEQYLMKDPKRRKKRMLRFIDEKLVHHAFLSPMVPFYGDSKYPDPCNTKRKTWYNPWLPDVKRNDDVYSIMVKKIYELNDLVLSYQKYISGDLAINELLEQIGNKSYLTGLEQN